MEGGREEDESAVLEAEIVIRGVPFAKSSGNFGDRCKQARRNWFHDQPSKCIDFRKSRKGFEVQLPAFWPICENVTNFSQKLPIVIVLEIS